MEEDPVIGFGGMEQHKGIWERQERTERKKVGNRKESFFLKLGQGRKVRKKKEGRKEDSKKKTEKGRKMRKRDTRE